MKAHLLKTNDKIMTIDYLLSKLDRVLIFKTLNKVVNYKSSKPINRGWFVTSEGESKILIPFTCTIDEVKEMLKLDDNVLYIDSPATISTTLRYLTS